MGTSLISNPPYNLRWKHPDLLGFMPQYMGTIIPPESNANFAFILTALNIVDDKAVILLPNNVLVSQIKEEIAIRKHIVLDNVLKAVILLPPDMFESTSIATSILVFDKHKDTRKIAMIDLSERCVKEIREQRGQYGGRSHEERVYKKTINVIPKELMDAVLELIQKKEEKQDFAKFVLPEQISERGFRINPKEYIGPKLEEIKCRSFEDIIADYNRIIDQKNAIHIKINKTAAKRLGYACMDIEQPDITKIGEIIGQKVVKEKFLTFTASDGITISISTKTGINPLIIDFLNHWKQMIIYLNNEENRLLAELRDAMIPKLMSGEMKI